MFANRSLTVNPLFVRHDLLIELGRLEAALGAARDAPANDHDRIGELATRREALNDTLRLLTG